MSQVNLYGMLLYLALALFGGFLTGLFSQYVYQLALADFRRTIAILFAAIFFVAPGWAAISLFKDDDLDIFYVLLILSFIYGVYFFHQVKPSNSTIQQNHNFPPDDDA